MVTERNPDYPEPLHPRPLPGDTRTGRVDPEFIEEEEILEPNPFAEGGFSGGGRPPVLTAVGGEFDGIDDDQEIPELTEEEQKDYQNKLRNLWDKTAPQEDLDLLNVIYGTIEGLTRDQIADQDLPPGLQELEGELEHILIHTHLSTYAKKYIKRVGMNTFVSGQVPDEVLPLLLFDYFSIFQKGANLRQNEEVLLEHHRNEIDQYPESYDLSKEEEFAYNWQEEINKKYS